MQWLEEEEFSNAMARFRAAPRENLQEVNAAFEAVKQLIRENCEEIDLFPDSRFDGCDCD
jgi:hypothetical protein